DADDPFAPVAHLEGYGPIGPALVGYLACLGQVTVVTTAGAAPDSGVLNVGRTRRVATLRQRKAVEAHQANRCATPACNLPVAEIHHLTWWSAGGPTDLDNLIGLCEPCHRLVHHSKLVITVPEPEPVPEPVLATRPQSRTPRRTPHRRHPPPTGGGRRRQRRWPAAQRRRVTRSARAPRGPARGRRPAWCRTRRGTRRGCARCWRGTPAGCAGRWGGTAGRAPRG